MKNKFIFLVGIVIAILVAGFFYNKYRVAPKVKFETLKLTDLNGNKISLDSFQGQKMFINFFATWCGPCIKEVPSLLSAQQILAKENFRFVLISDEPIERLKHFQEQTGTRVPILHSEKKLLEYKIYTIPTSYVLNSNHEIVFKKTGEEDWASDAVIQNLKNLAE